MNIIWAKQALTRQGWQSNVRIAVNEAGMIDSVSCNTAPCGKRVDIALPAPCNLHSHGFQRALAGLTERRSEIGADSFWTWRKLMYAFIEQLTPEDIAAITAYAQLEMLESGFAAVAEFHYVHHHSDGKRYGDLAELSNRIIAATDISGIGLTLLPVFYQYGGCGKRNPLPQQSRFINSMDTYLKLFEQAAQALKGLPADCRMGMAVHSLRAVDPADVVALHSVHPNMRFHIHVAEQLSEIKEFQSVFGLRPVEWLNRNAELNETWCLVHATHMTETETLELAKSGAVVGLCPITEANLGDGIFNAVDYVKDQGRYGVGTDSNIRISLCEELRTLEYSQRLKHRQRVVLANPGESCGRELFDAALLGGSLALARLTGVLEPGYLADVLALDGQSELLSDCKGDEILDCFIFAGDNHLVTDVWSAGRHVVRDGRHVNRQKIEAQYIDTKAQLTKRLSE